MGLLSLRHRCMSSDQEYDKWLADYLFQYIFVDRTSSFSIANSGSYGAISFNKDTGVVTFSAGSGTAYYITNITGTTHSRRYYSSSANFKPAAADFVAMPSEFTNSSDYGKAVKITYDKSNITAGILAMYVVFKKSSDGTIAKVANTTGTYSTFYTSQKGYDQIAIYGITRSRPVTGTLKLGFEVYNYIPT